MQERRRGPTRPVPFGRRGADAGVALTARQWQVLELVTQGLQNKEIAAALGIHEPAAKKQVSKLLRKFGASSRASLAVAAVSMRLTGLGRWNALAGLPIEYLFYKASPLIGLLRGPELVLEHANEALVQATAGRALIGRPLRAAARALAGTEFLQAVEAARGDRQRRVIHELAVGWPRGGSKRSFNVVVQPLAEDTEVEDALLVYAIDVTDEFQAHRDHAALALSGASLVEHAPLGVVVVDANGYVVLMNDRGKEIAPVAEPTRPLADQVGRYGLREPSTHRDLRPDETPIARALKGEHVRGYRFLFRRGDADVLLEATAAPIRDRVGSITGAVAYFDEV